MSRPGGGAAAGPAMRYNTTDGEKPRIVLFVQAHGVCPLDAAANTRSQTDIPRGMNLRVFSIPGAKEFNPGLMGNIRSGSFPEHPEFEGRSIDMCFPSILARNLRKQPFARAWADMKGETVAVYNVSGVGDELRAPGGTPFTDVENVAESRWFQFHKNPGENTSATRTRVKPVNTVAELYGVFIADSNMPEIVASNLPFTTISDGDLNTDPENRPNGRLVGDDHLFVSARYMNARNMVSRTGGKPIGAPTFISLIKAQSCPKRLKDQAIHKINHMWKKKNSTLAHILDILSVFQKYDPTGAVLEGIDVFVVDPTCRGVDSGFVCPREVDDEVPVVESQEFDSQPSVTGAAAPAPAPVPTPTPSSSSSASTSPSSASSASSMSAPVVALAPARFRTPPRRSSRGRRSRSPGRGRSHAPGRGRSRSHSSSSSSSPRRGRGSSQTRNRDRSPGRGRGQGSAQGGVPHSSNPQSGGNKQHLSISNSSGGYRRTKRKSKHNRTTKHRVKRVNLIKRTATKQRR